MLGQIVVRVPILGQIVLGFEPHAGMQILVAWLWKQTVANGGRAMTCRTVKRIAGHCGGVRGRWRIGCRGGSIGIACGQLA